MGFKLLLLPPQSDTTRSWAHCWPFLRTAWQRAARPPLGTSTWALSH
jgi:hypothetical protein